MGTRRRAEGGQGEAPAPRWLEGAEVAGRARCADPPESEASPPGLTRAPLRLCPRS